MPLADFFAPDETISYEAPFQVKVGDQDYQLYITNRRLIIYMRKGLVFKKDTFIGVNIDDIQGTSYNETGIIPKKGIITIRTPQQVLPFKGSAGNMKILYQQIQGHGIK